MLNFVVTKSFQNSAKILLKRYKSFKNDLLKFKTNYDSLPYADLGGGFRKIRISIESKGKGESGGARIITYEVLSYETERDVILLYVYDKSDMEDISISFLKQLVKDNL